MAKYKALTGSAVKGLVVIVWHMSSQSMMVKSWNTAACEA